MNDQIKILCTEPWSDYELLDTGEGERLERFGKYILARPYEDASWPKSANAPWQRIDGHFSRGDLKNKSGWKIKNSVLPRWEMLYKGIKFFASPTPFRHMGFFPEQATHWDFIEQKIKESLQHKKNFAALPASGLRHGQNFSYTSGIKFLNLFGYTGVASLFALRAGAEVTHLDASKQSLKWAKDNQILSSMGNLPMRVIEDDALKFLEREIKRGNKYDAIIIDPPKFGRGPKGEVWKLEEKLPKLLKAISAILSEKPIFVILNSYAVDSSSLNLFHALSHTMRNFEGKINFGELTLKETSNGRLIPLANTAIWSQA